MFDSGDYAVPTCFDAVDEGMKELLSPFFGHRGHLTNVLGTPLRFYRQENSIGYY